MMLSILKTWLLMEKQYLSTFKWIHTFVVEPWARFQFFTISILINIFEYESLTTSLIIYC